MGNQPNEGGAQKEPAVGLKRTLGLREAITITAGTVIGVQLLLQDHLPGVRRRASRR